MKENIKIEDFENLFIKNANDVLYYMELPSGAYKYISKSAETIFGYSQEEFINNPKLIKKLLHPDWKNYFEAEWEKLIVGNVPSFYEYSIIDKNGNVKWLNQRNSIEKDSEGNVTGIKGLITDITKYKNLEDELGDTRRRFDRISQTSSDWVWEVDVNGVYTYVSERVKEFLGYSVDEIIGKTPFDTMPKEEAKSIGKKFMEYASNQEPFKDLENINIHKNGSYVVLQTSGFPIFDKNGRFAGYRGTDRDITDLNNLITNLNEAQTLSKIGHWELDLVKNELYWSDEVYRIFGLLPQEFAATYEAFLEHIHPDDHDLVNSAYSKSLEDHSSYNIKHRVLTKNGELRYVEERCIHKLNTDGEIIKSIGTVHDITQQVKYEKDLEVASNVFKYSTDGIIITDKDNLIVSVNESFEKLTGYTNAEVIGKNPKLFSSGWGDKEFYKNMWQELKKNDFFKDELWDRKKDGTLYAISMSIVCVRDAEGDIINYIAISHDITESKDKEREIHQLAYYDFLTKLPNRKLFQQELESYIKSSHFNSKKFAVLFLDLDNFKWVNDSLGHHFGDKVLVEVSQILTSLVLEDSLVARLGGDEFVIISPFHDQLEISKLATSILESVSHPIIIDSTEINVGWSIGISIFPDNANSATDLLKNADTAMYQAKESGKNSFRYFNNTMNNEAVKRLELDTKLRHAIKHDAFTLNYQPKFSCENNSISGVEALIRWSDSKLGFIPPDKFIPIAEESGYMKEIGTWVIKKALEDLKIIHENADSKITMAINISPKQLEEDDFYQSAKEIIEESGIDSKYIEFEITETSIMKDIDSVIALISKIKKLGVTISIDDFGTGYSSMAYLKKLPLDILKIDRAFVMELEHDEDSNSIVQAIMALSKALKLTTIAEGVETMEQKNILEELGCNFFQGYLYSKPLELNKLLEFMKN